MSCWFSLVWVSALSFIDSCLESVEVLHHFGLGRTIDRVRNDFTVSSPILSTHLCIWACGSTWRRHTGKHGSSATHQRITQLTSWPHVASPTWSSTEQVARPATKRFHTSDWRPLHGGVLSTVDMVVQRRDGRRWHCEHDDDDDLSYLQCFNPVDWLRARGTSS